MGRRTFRENRIKLSKDDLKVFFELITKKTTLEQLSRQVNIKQPNLTYYKNGKYTMPESFFEYALKFIGKAKTDFNFETLPPTWGSSKGGKKANSNPIKIERNRKFLSKIMKNKWKDEEFRKKRIKSIKDQEDMTMEKIRIISHLLFDGTVCNRKGYNYIRFTCSSPKVINQFIDDVKTVYGLERYRTIDENDNNCKSIDFNSILVIQDLLKYAKSYSCKSKNICIPDVIKYGNYEFKREFLRCFWADEGGITVSPKYKRFILIGGQTNLKFLNDIARIHDYFKIKYLLYEKFRQLLIVRKSEKKKFLKKISFLEGSLVTKGKYKGMNKNLLLKKLIMGIIP